MSFRSLASSFSPTLPDSPMSAIRASPGMTRMSAKTISEERTRTGTASSSRRAMYLYMGGDRASTSPLLVDPRPRDRRRPVAVGASQRTRAGVADVRLEDEEAVV